MGKGGRQARAAGRQARPAGKGGRLGRQAREAGKGGFCMAGMAAGWGSVDGVGTTICF